MREVTRGWFAAAVIYVALVVVLSLAAITGDHLAVYQALVVVTLPIGILMPIATYVVGATLAGGSSVGLDGASWLTAVYVLMYGAAAMTNVVLGWALVKAVAVRRRPAARR